MNVGLLKFFFEVLIGLVGFLLIYGVIEEIDNYHGPVVGFTLIGIIVCAAGIIITLISGL